MELWQAAVLVAIAAPLLLFGATKIIACAWFAAKREHTRRVLREFDDDTN